MLLPNSLNWRKTKKIELAGQGCCLLKFVARKSLANQATRSPKKPRLRSSSSSCCTSKGGDEAPEAHYASHHCATNFPQSPPSKQMEEPRHGVAENAAVCGFMASSYVGVR